MTFQKLKLLKMAHSNGGVQNHRDFVHVYKRYQNLGKNKHFKEEMSFLRYSRMAAMWGIKLATMMTVNMSMAM